MVDGVGGVGGGGAAAVEPTVVMLCLLPLAATTNKVRVGVVQSEPS